MTSRERVAAAMRPGDGARPDRAPVMCQLALGHYFLNSGFDPVDIWHDSRVFGHALAALQRRYGFDGILVNLPGRDPEWRRHVVSIERGDTETHVRWVEGLTTIVPRDENPRLVNVDMEPLPAPSFADLEPDSLFYVEPHERLGVTRMRELTPWQFRTMDYVRSIAPEVSVHGEVFSPFSQLIELLGCTAAMLALVDDGEKAAACLSRLTEGAIALGRGLFAAGADAVLISSAYAGAGFISRSHYEQFVLPFERRIVLALTDGGRIVYTHTCGAIGDRLDLMERSGTRGIDTLDPPPLGTVDLVEARRQLARSVFIKGNIDPVNTVLRGSASQCLQAARERLAHAGRDGGYILSTACSVPPHAPPANILQLVRAAQESPCAA